MKIPIAEIKRILDYLYEDEKKDYKGPPDRLSWPPVPPLQCSQNLFTIKLFYFSNGSTGFRSTLRLG